MAEVYTQARIRVNAEGAAEVYDALLEHGAYLSRVQNEMLESENKEAVLVFRRRRDAVQRVIDEVERVLNEQGWSGEPIRTVS